MKIRVTWPLFVQSYIKLCKLQVKYLPVPLKVNTNQRSRERKSRRQSYYEILFSFEEIICMCHFCIDNICWWSFCCGRCARCSRMLLWNFNFVTIWGYGKNARNGLQNSIEESIAGNQLWHRARKISRKVFRSVKETEIHPNGNESR